MYPSLYPQYNFGAIGSTLGQLVSAFTQSGSAYPATTYPYSPYATPMLGYSPVTAPNPYLTYGSSSGFGSMLGGSTSLLLIAAAVVIVIVIMK